jgi:D-arabinose 1-dehydrogenase-like Zn-dependent alcohol dehydrogenase
MVQSGIMGNTFPRIPGHEIIGDVVAVGDGELKWKAGDRVGGPWHGGRLLTVLIRYTAADECHLGHDHACRSCQRGQFQMCENEAINGVTRDGGYAEYVLLRTEAVVRVPKDVDPVEYAPILCAGITVFNSIRKQNITLGELVAIQGLGGLGHLAVQCETSSFLSPSGRGRKQLILCRRKQDGL